MAWAAISGVITAILLTPVWLTYRIRRRAWKRTVGRVTRFEEFDVGPEKYGLWWFVFTVGDEVYEVPDLPTSFVRYDVGDEVIVRYPDDASWEKAEIEQLPWPRRSAERARAAAVLIFPALAIGAWLLP